jgi:hypothetical protein
MNQVMKPNYQFDKRQRELEKKKKKAQKMDKKTLPADLPTDTEVANFPEDKGLMGST